VAVVNHPLSTYIPLKTRWAIASRLDRLPGFCWADLVGWVMNEDRGEHKLMWARNWSCTQEYGGVSSNCGSCYCGKRRTAEADVVMRADGCSPGVIVDAEGRRVR
jgi:hypothetical protein